MSPVQPIHPLSPPPVPESNASSGVRRHHTISSSSRRTGARSTISEDSQGWNDDEVVDQDWVGGVGAVGETSSTLHRQASLPTRYSNRPFRPSQQASRTPGNLTPRTLNSLTAIAGHEGDEEEWEREMRGLRSEDEHTDLPHNAHLDTQSQSSGQSPLSPHFNPIPSPPPAGSGVRRHQSLTYGAAGSDVRRIPSSGLKRAGTLQAQVTRGHAHAQTPSPPDAEEEYGDEYVVEEDFQYPQQQQQQQAAMQGQGQGQYPGSPIGRSPWSTPNNEWRTTTTTAGGAGGSAIDDVQRALSALEIASNPGQNYLVSNNVYQTQGGTAPNAPRFNPKQQQQGVRGTQNQNPNGVGSRKLQLVTDLGSAQVPMQGQGPASAAAYLPTIGQHSLQQSPMPSQRARERDDRDRALTASGAWEQKDRVLQGRSSNPNLNYQAGYNQGQVQGGAIPGVPAIPPQYLNQQGGQPPRLGVITPFGQGGQSQTQTQVNLAGNQPVQGFINSPIDVPNLIATKGYNPTNFDIRPQFARYFVIKSYTEDDVHKSLKYEIWSSTDPGNKRLDKAFKECAGRGPIYLFFSVNASGHFCGMAEMLTPVDYTRSSTVWASDKWKGVFKVRWIFVRDVPNANLRHIRLNNTQERKPVTNSRDTQELLPDAGQEMLRTFFSHPARTSLLQDFAFYELQAMQKLQQQQQSQQPSPSTSNSPLPTLHTPQIHQGSPQAVAQQQQQQQQQSFVIPNPNAMPYPSQHLQMPPMPPMMQMQMGSQYPLPHAIQNVMRHPSPVPIGSGPGYMDGYGRR